LYFSVETQLDQISLTGVNSEQPEKVLASWLTTYAIQQSNRSQQEWSTEGKYSVKSYAKYVVFYH
jgi:hypothetical protein